MRPAALLALLPLLACAPAPVVAPPIAVAPPPPAPDSASPPAPVAPAPTVSAVAPSPIAPGDPSAGEPDVPEPIETRPGAPGSTRGTISCGKFRCRAGKERCFFDEAAQAWACGRAGAIEANPMLVAACDDASDCGAGEVCCRSVMSAYAPVCVARSRFADECLAELCDVGGPACPAGRSCVARKPGAQGECEAPAGPATCAGGVKCPKDAPICVVDHGRLACVAEGSPAFMAVDVRSRYRCTRQEDCHAGDVCSYTYGEFRRPGDLGTTCGKLTPGITGTLVCEPSGPPPFVPPKSLGAACVGAKRAP